MKTISVAVYKRINYFQEMLESLLQNDLKGWQIFFSIDPSENIKKIVKLIQHTLNGKVSCHINNNQKRMGVEINTYLSQKMVFNAGSRINIYLEEDLIISPDITKLADWYSVQSHDQIMCLNLLYGACGGINHVSKNIPEAIVKTKQFNGCGVVLTREQW